MMHAQDMCTFQTLTTIRYWDFHCLCLQQRMECRPCAQNSGDIRAITRMVHSDTLRYTHQQLYIHNCTCGVYVCCMYVCVWLSTDNDRFALYFVFLCVFSGLKFDARGRLYICEGGNSRRVTRMTHELQGDVPLTVIASHYNGKRLNSPNDLVLDSQSKYLYFTDPRYGNRSNLELTVECVFRVDLTTTNTANNIECIISDLIRPNGIALSSDETELYVVDNPTDYFADNVKRSRGVYAFAVNDWSTRRMVYDFGAGRGVCVWSNALHILWIFILMYCVCVFGCVCVCICVLTCMCVCLPC